MLFQFLLVEALHHVRLGIDAYGRVSSAESSSFVRGLRRRRSAKMFLCQDFDYMGVKLIVHLQPRDPCSGRGNDRFALVRLHDHVALHSHAFDIMSFLPKVTSQPSHISLFDFMTHSSVSSAQPSSAGAHLLK